MVKDVLQDRDGTRHVRYDRTYGGLPVVGGDLVVHEGPDRELSGVEWSTERGTDEEGGSVETLVYTDARTGRVIASEAQIHHADGTGHSQWSGTVTLKTNLSGSTYQLHDTTRGGHKTNDANNSTSQTAPGTLFTDSDNVWENGSSSSRQTAAVDAHYGAAVTWDLYQDLFGRSGIRGDGVAAYLRVHYGTSYENAFWYDPCYGSSHTDHVQQQVAIPAAGSASLGFYLRVSSDETTSTQAYDTLKVPVVSGGTTTTVATYSNLDETSGYVLQTLDLSAWTAKTVTVKLPGVEDSSLATSFLVDDVSLTTA